MQDDIPYSDTSQAWQTIIQGLMIDPLWRQKDNVHWIAQSQLELNDMGAQLQLVTESKVDTLLELIILDQFSYGIFGDDSNQKAENNFAYDLSLPWEEREEIKGLMSNSIQTSIGPIENSRVTETISSLTDILDDIIDLPDIDIQPVPPPTDPPNEETSLLPNFRTVGNRLYEITDHLGNVSTTITDRRLTFLGASDSSEVIQATSYWPFGMQLSTYLKDVDDEENRYRYSFQGQETDNEVYGQGNLVNYKYRMHDPRLGRFFSVDPLSAKYPWNSSYAFSENRVVDGIELEGLERYYSADGSLIGKYGESQEVRVVNSNEVEFASKEFSSSSINSGYLDFYLPSQGSSLLSESSGQIKTNVLKTIAEKDLNLSLGDTRIQGNESSGNAALYSDSRNLININSSESYFNNYQFLQNAIIKENTHRSDADLDKTLGIAGRELNGYLSALNHKSFINAPEEYKKTFLQGAGGFIWEFHQESLINNSSNFKAWTDFYLNEFEKNGVKFDFGNLEESRKIQVEFDGSNESRYYPDNHEVKVSY